MSFSKGTNRYEFQVHIAFVSVDLNVIIFIYNNLFKVWPNLNKAYAFTFRCNLVTLFLF